MENKTAETETKKTKKSRARKTSGVPTQIYSYGCFAPVVGAELFEEQLRLAHRYRNKLVEIERTRRRRVDDVFCFWPDVARASEDAHMTEVAVDEAYRALKGAKTGVGKDAEISGERELVIVAKAQQQVAWAALKAAKAIDKNDERRAVCMRWCDELAYEEVRQARGTCGVYWGTYLQVETAVEQSIKESFPDLPRFTKFCGEGKIAVQIQKSKPLGARSIFGSDTRLRLQPIPEDTYQRRRHHRRLASRSKVSIRIGSDGVKPIWAELPVILHRPLPDDVQIKWAWINKRKKGLQFVYDFQLAVESATFVIPLRQSEKPKAIAIDIGWRRRAGGVRSGYWVDSDGKHGEIAVPEKVIIGLKKTDDLQSIRAKTLDQIKTVVIDAKWSDRRDDKTHKTWPEWLIERTRFIVNWRSAEAMHALLAQWQKSRFDGDEKVVDALVAWAKQDRHLDSWENNQRRSRHLHRREVYRIFAAKIAREYTDVIVEDFDLPSLDDWEVPDATKGVPSDGRDQRRTSRRAAAGELRQCILRAADKYGARKHEENPAWTTQRCHKCNCDEKWDAAPALLHTCTKCGSTWDQDYNACVNLLRASGTVTPDWLPPLADADALVIAREESLTDEKLRAFTPPSPSFSGTAREVPVIAAGTFRN